MQYRIVILLMMAINVIFLPMFLVVMADYNKIDGLIEVIADLSESNVNIRDIGTIHNSVYIDTTATVNNNTIKLRLEYPPPPQNLNIKSDDSINRWISAMRSPTNVLANIKHMSNDSNTVYQAYSEPIIITWWVICLAILLFADIQIVARTWMK